MEVKHFCSISTVLIMAQLVDEMFIDSMLSMKGCVEIEESISIKRL